LEEPQKVVGNQKATAGCGLLPDIGLRVVVEELLEPIQALHDGTQWSDHVLARW
jgi:hypothetical protein